jgi:SAM-dependent methyltransferase
MFDSTRRFSNRVDNYIKYRPRYPVQVLTFLREELNLQPTNIIADVGSGTGILSELFLQNGNVVYGVEPNREMREASIRLLSAYDHFKPVDGTAEATTLADNSVDFITAGQAFHWFDPQKTRIEFSRIIKAGGYVILVWNTRWSEGSPFLIEYEDLITHYATEYRDVCHKNVDDEAFEQLYGGNKFHLETFSNHQLLDLESLKGRLLSSSYAPLEDHPNHAPLLTGLADLFARYAMEGRVRFEYKTELFYGKLT